MKCDERIVGLSLLLFLCPVALAMLLELASGAFGELLVDGENELNQEESPEGQGRLTQQQGSWSHWWSYDGISGPDYWNINKRWRLCGSGQRQSPVEVRTERLVYDHLLGPFRLTWLAQGQSWRDTAADQIQSGAPGANEEQRRPDEEQPIKAQLLNSGRGLELWLEASEPRRPAGLKGAAGSDQLVLSGGPLSYHYKLYKLELHSAPPAGSAPGAGPRPGSEHLIDGRHFDAELQLHFYNRHLASSALEAQRMAEGDAEHPAAPSASLYAIISVFLVSVGDDTHKLNPSAAPNHRSPIDFMLDQTLAEGDSGELTLTRRQLEQLVPSRSQYITYQGSLNRPPCAELADWLLVNQALKVHVHKFRQLFSEQATGNGYQENIRPVKALNGRLLRTTIDLAGGARHHQADMGLRRAPVDCQSTGADSNNKPRLNCSQQEQDGRQRAPTIGACSMRPQYVYQLSQGIRN